MRTLKVISYRATHFLSFLIIIMVINVYKLKSLTPDERSAETKQMLCTYVSQTQGDDTGAILLFLQDCPPPPPPFCVPSLLVPQVTTRSKVPRTCRSAGNQQSLGTEADS